MNSEHIRYDGTYAGFLSSVYLIFKSKLKVISFNDHSSDTKDIFSTNHAVVTNEDLADRVKAGLIRKSTRQVVHFIYRCFLSEQDGVELKLLYLIRLILTNRASEIKNYADPIIMDLHKINKSIGREVHRMHAFVRFQETKDGVYAAVIEPDFDVLPLLPSHFIKRYPAFNWIIYDVRRKYGLLFEAGEITEISFLNGPVATQNNLPKSVITTEEQNYQKMWIQYFDSVNISERNNPKLHRRHVPKRYWKYLVEKNVQQISHT